jgi:hypothetical protein
MEGETKMTRVFNTLSEAKTEYSGYEFQLIETDVAPNGIVRTIDKYHPSITAPSQGDRWSLYKLSDTTMYKPYVWVAGKKARK